MINPILRSRIDSEGRLVNRETRQNLQQMTDAQVLEFRAYHVGTYSALVQAADDELAWRQYCKENKPAT